MCALALLIRIEKRALCGVVKEFFCQEVSKWVALQESARGDQFSKQIRLQKPIFSLALVFVQGKSENSIIF